MSHPTSWRVICTLNFVLSEEHTRLACAHLYPILFVFKITGSAAFFEHLSAWYRFWFWWFHLTVAAAFRDQWQPDQTFYQVKLASCNDTIDNLIWRTQQSHEKAISLRRASYNFWPDMCQPALLIDIRQSRLLCRWHYLTGKDAQMSGYNTSYNIDQ